MLVPICVQSICIILMLQQKYYAPLQHQLNWCQPPLPTSYHPSRANDGAPVPKPANVGPYIPRSSHQCPIQSISPIQPVYKSQFLLANQRPITIRSSQYNPADTIQTIHPIWSSRYDPAILSSKWNPPTILSLIRKTHPQLPQLLIFHPPQRPLTPEIFYPPLLLHLMSTSLIHIEIALLTRPIFLPF